MFGGLIQYPFGSAADLANIQGWFNIDLMKTLVGLGAIGIGIAMLLTRQNTYAIYAMLLFGFGIAFTIVGNFLLAIPNTLGALIPNPFPGSVNPFGVVIGVIVAYAGFWWLLSLVLQRDV
jgi:hypothetical protein